MFIFFTVSDETSMRVDSQQVLSFLSMLQQLLWLP